MQVPAVEQVAAVPVPMHVVVPESMGVPLSGLRVSQGVQMVLKNSASARAETVSSEVRSQIIDPEK